MKANSCSRLRHCQPSCWLPCLWSRLLPWQQSQQNQAKWPMILLSQSTAWIISTGHLHWQFSLNSIRWDRDIFPPLSFATVTVTSTETGTEKLHQRRKVNSSATSAMCPCTHLAELVLQRALIILSFPLWYDLQKKLKKTS